LLFDKQPETPESQNGPEWSLGCIGIVVGVVINLVAVVVAVFLTYLSGSSQVVNRYFGIVILALLVAVNVLVISWGFKKQETSFAAGLIIAACLVLLLYSQCGFS
jgi:hypothetical protein